MPTALAAPVQTRSAAYADAAAILAIDDGGRQRQARANFVHLAISSRSAHVATLDNRVVAFGVLQYAFFNHGFINLLTVHGDHRRRGIGAWLLRYMEQACKTPRLFTAAPRSDLHAHAFLFKLGYVASGTVENVDDAEPLALFFKKLR